MTLLIASMLVCVAVIALCLRVGHALSAVLWSINLGLQVAEFIRSLP